MKRMAPFYRELLQKTRVITHRARELCRIIDQPQPELTDIFGPNTLQPFIVRTERVADTATRRMINGQKGSEDGQALQRFRSSHTQLYKRGKAGQPMQFGRQALMFEDAAGFIVRGVLMNRDKSDKDVAVRETELLQKMFSNRVKRLSFDRGFHTSDNQTDISEFVTTLCLAKPGVKQSDVQQAEASDEFPAAQQWHPGVELAIGSLQRGNALKRCCDRSKVGLERYLSLPFWVATR